MDETFTSKLGSCKTVATYLPNGWTLLIIMLKHTLPSAEKPLNCRTIPFRGCTIDFVNVIVLIERVEAINWSRSTITVGMHNQEEYVMRLA